MKRPNRLVQSVTRSPFVWGLLAAVGFYALIFVAPPEAAIVKLFHRYFASHPVEYMETVMFSVGLAALVLKAFDIAAQRASLRESLLSPASASGATALRLSHPTSDAADCDALVEGLDRLPGRRQGEYYVARVRAALEHVRRLGSADSLDDELKYLSDLDASRMQNGYGLFRVIVWAIPILGFLGTVIGITMMLTGAAQIATGTDNSAMFKIFEGLGLKFDTTALALTLSMILMFVHFSVERSESRLLEAVDDRVRDEFTGRFRVTPSGGEGQLAAIRQLAEAMLQTSDVLMQRQAELWQSAVDTAAGRWAEMAAGASEQVKTAMSAATSELTQRADVLERAVAAATEVTRLETALNQNLAALAGARHFEQTVLSLAAAVNMLSARFVEAPGAAEPIKLETKRRTAHAA